MWDKFGVLNTWFLKVVLLIARKMLTDFTDVGKRYSRRKWKRTSTNRRIRWSYKTSRSSKEWIEGNRNANSWGSNSQTCGSYSLIIKHNY